MQDTQGKFFKGLNQKIRQYNIFTDTFIDTLFNTVCFDSLFCGSVLKEGLQTLQTKILNKINQPLEQRMLWFIYLPFGSCMKNKTFTQSRTINACN